MVDRVTGGLGRRQSCDILPEFSPLSQGILIAFPFLYNLIVRAQRSGVKSHV